MFNSVLYIEKKIFWVVPEYASRARCIRIISKWSVQIVAKVKKGVCRFSVIQAIVV